jgi:hypothetical protein
MNEAKDNVCGCNPCVGSSCACGCQDGVTREACSCGPECGCGDACRKIEA